MTTPKIILFLFLALPLAVLSQNPHGEDFGVDCKKCHHSGGWDIRLDEITFDHAETGFELEGQHESVTCTDCHTELTFKSAENDCFSCHQDVHQQTVGNDCARCHDSQSWLVFDIPELHEQNGFPLQGTHRVISCNDCHTAGNALAFAPIGNECIDCHREDYLTTSEPNHAEVGFSLDCIECHNTDATDWSAGGDFHLFFPLTGNHDMADCNACHTSPPYSAISAECSSCHLDDYTGTIHPNHSTAGYSTDCTECHDVNTIGWNIPGFHSFFALTGAHNVDDCTECHLNPDYTQISSECSSCHLDDYNATNEPNHSMSGISTNCADCHDANTTSWDIPGFHGFFALTGVHDVADCAQCHTDPDYTTTSSECSSCHMDDFNNTTDPNHAAQGFSTDCTLCHTLQPGWSPASFSDHDGQYFPIYSGKHQGEWNTCIDCHTTPNNYQLFSCIDCHEHNDAADLADEHSGVSGYVYQSAACYNCHPDGSE